MKWLMDAGKVGEPGQQYRARRGWDGVPGNGYMSTACWFANLCLDAGDYNSMPSHERGRDYGRGAARGSDLPAGWQGKCHSRNQSKGSVVLGSGHRVKKWRRKVALMKSKEHPARRAISVRELVLTHGGGLSKGHRLLEAKDASCMFPTGFSTILARAWL